MRKEVRIILQSLSSQNLLVSSIGKQMMHMLERRQDLTQFIENLRNEIQLLYDLHGDHRPFYYFYVSIGYLALNDGKRAKEFLANAVQGFRIGGYSLNEALGEWLFAIIHLKGGSNIRAQLACETAVKIMTRLINRYKEESHYEEANEYTKHLIQIKNLLQSIKTLPPVEIKGSSENYHSPSQQSYITLPWLPKYDSVRAGPKGIIWVDSPFKNGAIIHTVEIDNTPCEIISTLSSANVEDHQINLNRHMDYGWAKVVGHSMNASKPVAIREGDYVLFTKHWHSDKDAIVIACRWLNASEYSYMIKKFRARDCELVSETIDTSEDYSPIHLNEEYQILGTVIAVAKPKNHF
jgi:hypothetical protein